MGRGYTRIIGVKKFWLITALLGLEIVNLQVLVDFLGSGLSAALSVLWIFVVVVMIGSNIEDIMNLLQGRYTLDKKQITERLDEITRKQEELEGKYQAVLAGWETKIAGKLATIVDNMPLSVEQIKTEIEKNAGESKQSLLKSLMDLEQGIKTENLIAKEQRDKTQEKIAELLSELVNVSKQIIELSDSAKFHSGELDRKCTDILETIGREAAGFTQQVEIKTGAITQLLEIKSAEVEGRLTAGTDKHAELLKVSVDAIRQQVMRSDESLVHTINKMQLDTEERVKVYKRMVETAFAELTAEFVNLEGEARLRHKELTAQVSDNVDLMKQIGPKTESVVQQGIDMLTEQIASGNENVQNSITRIDHDIKDGVTNISEAIKDNKKILEKQEEAIRQYNENMFNKAITGINDVKEKMDNSFVELRKQAETSNEKQSDKIDNFSEDIIRRLSDLKENNESQGKQVTIGQENIQQVITELKKETLGKLSEVHVNLVDSFAALQKDEETKTKSRLAKFDIAIKDITQRLNALQESNAERKKLLEVTLESHKGDIKQGWDGLLKALTGDLQELRRELADVTKPLSEELSKVAENVAAVKDVSSEQQHWQEDQQDNYKEILSGQDRVQSDLRNMEANIANWQDNFGLLDGLEKRLATLQNIVDTLAVQQQKLLDLTVKSQPLEGQHDRKTAKQEKKKSKKVQQADRIAPPIMEEPVIEDETLAQGIVEESQPEPVPVLEPNRTEIIEDKENNTTIMREFRDNEIYMDLMMVNDVRRHEIYYANGNPKRAVNFDDSGDNIQYELEYYPNGEAKQRTEYVMRNGEEEKIVSKFDEKGNKLS